MKRKGKEPVPTQVTQLPVQIASHFLFCLQSAGLSESPNFQASRILAVVNPDQKRLYLQKAGLQASYK